MYFSLILPLLPLALSAATPAKGTPGAFLSCIDSNFEGPCKYHSPPANERLGHCYDFDPGAWDAISSIKLDPGAYCWFFTHEMCTGDHVELKWPGTENLRGLRWDNSARSWTCWANGT